MSNEEKIEELKGRIVSIREILDSGSLGRCSRGVAMANEEIAQCEAELERLTGEPSNVK
jgi:hypothetical protein